MSSLHNRELSTSFTEAFPYFETVTLAGKQNDGPVDISQTLDVVDIDEQHAWQK